MAIPHNSKCRYGERGAAAAKPKAQIILCAATVSAASGGYSEPKQGQRSQSARGFWPRSTMRVPQPDIIEHFGNADAVPEPPKRCLSRKAGIVRCCPRKEFLLVGERRGASRQKSASGHPSATFGDSSPQGEPLGCGYCKVAPPYDTNGKGSVGANTVRPCSLAATQDSAGVQCLPLHPTCKLAPTRGEPMTSIGPYRTRVAEDLAPEGSNCRAAASGNRKTPRIFLLSFSYNSAIFIKVGAISVAGCIFIGFSV